MAIRDRVRRALRKSEASDTISQADSNTTTTAANTAANASQSSSDGTQLEKTTSRLARAFTFSSSPDSKEKEKERAEKRERKAQDRQSRRRTHPRDRPLTTQNIRHQEMLGQFRMTFGASDPSQIETLSFVGVSPCCTRPSSRRGSLELDPMTGSTTSFSNSSSATDSSREE